MTMTGGGVFDSAVLLTGREAAERAGITYNAWKLATRTRTGRPEPDATEVFGGRRIQLWRPSSVDAWRARRRPTHAEIIATYAANGIQRVHRRTVAKHLRRHAAGDCGCSRSA